MKHSHKPFVAVVVLAAVSGASVLPHAPIVQVRSGPVLIEDMTWTEVRDAIASGRTTAIIYAGSTEQNGPHLALGKHNFVAHYVAQRIAEELGDTLVYPTLPFAPAGDPVAKTGHMRFPGTVCGFAYVILSLTGELLPQYQGKVFAYSQPAFSVRSRSCSGS